MKTIKSSILAAAIASVFAVPAMANDINVKVSGRAHMSVDQLDNGNDSGTNVSSNSSRLRFAANTKVTDDLEVIMQLEQNIRFDQSGGNFATRDSFVGLKGDFGTVRFGFFDTPLKAVRGKTDMFGDRIGDARNMTNVSTGVSNANFDNRQRNSIHYRTPSFSGMTVDVQYTPHNDSSTNLDSEQSAYSTSISYSAKGIYAALAYESYENSAAGADDPTAIRLGVSYDVSQQVKVSGLYQQASNVTGGDRSVWGVGSSYKMNDITLRGQFYQAGDADANDSGASMLALGVDRNYGRTLTLYAAYAITMNGDAAAYTVASGGRDTRLTAVAGEDSSAFSLGMVYNF